MTTSPGRILNVNVGVLGHVDSGKTSLVKALSTMLSTAALDKNPESRKRGITIDLGFSAFQIPVPESRRADFPNVDRIQFTLVDCPGHASLIKTVIGGAGIIDLMLLLIDINKGIQTQTAECLVIGEILSEDMIVVLNKVDLIPEEKRAEKIKKSKKKLAAIFSKTKFGKGVPMVPTSAAPGGGLLHADASASATEAKATEKPDIRTLVDCLLATLRAPKRKADGSFRFAIDHCFQIKGQGNVMTGTVLEGTVRVNDMVEIPSLGIERKIKSMQMFRKPVQSASQGDRVGICVTNFDARALERGVACSPKAVPRIGAAVAAVNRVRLFKGDVRSGDKFHLTIGHSTVMATATFFGNDITDVDKAQMQASRRAKTEAQGGGGDKKSKKKSKKAKGPKPFARPVYPGEFDKSKEYAYHELLLKDSESHPPGSQFVLLQFDQPVTCPLDSMVIGSKLDVSVDAKLVRIAFSGKLLRPRVKWDAKELEGFKIYKRRERVGAVERLQDEYTLIGKGLFSKGSDISSFIGLSVRLDSGLEGSISSSFGQTGKYKVSFTDPIPAELIQTSGGGSEEGKRKKKKVKRTVNSKITLPLKKYIFALDKKKLNQ